MRKTRNAESGRRINTASVYGIKIGNPSNPASPKMLELPNPINVMNMMNKILAPSCLNRFGNKETNKAAEAPNIAVQLNQKSK